MATPEEAPRFSDVEVRTRRAWVLAPLFFPTAFNLLSSAPGLHRGLFHVAQFLVTLLIIPAALAWRKWPVRRRGELSVDARAMRLDGEVVLERRAIKHALTFPDGDGFIVRVTSRRRMSRDLHVATSREAERLLAALEQSEAQVTATFRCTYGGAMFQWAVIVAMVGSMFASIPASFWLLRRSGHSLLLPALAMFAPLVLAAAAMWMRSCRVTVGADGIALRRPLRKGRFVPFSDVSDVRRDKGDVLVALGGARELVRLGCTAGHRRLHGIDADAPVLALLQRIEDARHRASRDVPLAARVLLARGSLGREEWLRRVGQLGDDAGSYRVSALPADELWKVVEDSRETAEVRAAAALAVRRTLDDAGRERVRLAASSIAEAPLRRVFTAVKTGDEAEISEALDELEAAEAPRPAARLTAVKS